MITPQTASLVRGVIILLSLVFTSFDAAALPCVNKETEKNITHISQGVFSPQYGLAPGQIEFPVAAFSIDKYPVTNCQFWQFVTADQAYAKKQLSSLFADDNYLQHWPEVAGQRSPLQGTESMPVINVSWFAAAAYCRARGARLPSVLEWEYVAAADETRKNASKDPAFVERILSWYSTPTPKGKMPAVGKGKPNAWGVYDIHGLVWEWTEDFNSVFAVGDSRRDGEELKNLFCGAAALSASDKANYAAYMRYALRNSLQANYTTENLGFRCAYSK